MRDLFRSKPTWMLLAAVMVVALIVPGAVFAIHSNSVHAAAQHTKYAATDAASKNSKFCSRVGQSLGVSQGAYNMCNPPSSSNSTHTQAGNPSFGSNVDAANPNEDRNPAGVQAYGQSETSIAASGQYVVEAWNDATGFFAPCGSPKNKEELTGFAFSNNGGATFKDLGGLPNSNCATSRTEGDPSVGVFTVGTQTFFYISSIFIPFTVPQNDLSITVCGVVGSGQSATLSCGDPVVAASSGQCVDFGGGLIICSFLDKEFISIDQARGRLYLSYTDFGVNFFPSDNFTNGQIELAVCDLTTPATPTCFNGSNPNNGTTAAAPYLAVAPGDLSCEREGAYPAVDPSSGDVYVAHEFNWATNIFGSFGGTVDCRAVPTTNQMNRVPFKCLTLTQTSSCTTLPHSATARVFSMDANFIPGYNRFPASDFPRVAVSKRAGTVSMVWNDARLHPMGDILLQSFNLDSLTRVQNRPVRVNADTSGGLHFLPALRNSDEDGNLPVSWYSRANANTTLTDVFAVTINPRATGPASHNTLITTGPTDWSATSSDIVPNFGDYTDNYAAMAPGGNDTKLYVAWSDGRIGEPQPFEGHVLTDQM